MAGWLVTCLVGWFVGCFNHQVGGRKSSKLAFKIIKLEPKSSKTRPKKLPGGVLGVPRGLLEGSWGALGPKRAPRAKK